MPYTVRSSEKLRKSASDFETEAMLYLMNFREDSSQMHYFVVDFFNDVTGMDRMAGRLWDIQSKASKTATAKSIGRELVTLYKNYISDFDFSEYILFLGAVPDTFRIDSGLNIFQIDNVNEKAIKSVKEGLLDECHKKDYIDKNCIPRINDEEINCESIEFPDNVTIVKVKNIRHSLAIASCNLYDYPSKKLKLIGVTGTKGKTTSTYMIKSILQQAGFKVGLIGSIAIYINDQKIEDMDRTSAESYKLQKTLAMMVEQKVDIVVLEVSSQAMKLDRVTGCDFDRVLFTNLSEDHISPREHKDMEDYFNAKLSLAKMAPIVVYNSDNEYTARIPVLLKDIF